MASNLLNELAENWETLSPIEGRIADFILRDPKMFITYSMTQLSDIAEVSQGSINNFSKKFSGGGFPALKLKIAGELATGGGTSFSDVSREDSVKDVLSKTIKDANSALNKTLENNNNETLKSVAERILKAKKVEIYGVFRSAVIATDMYYQLLTLGIPAAYVADVLTCAVSASMLDSQSLVIAVSSSGRTKDIIDAVKAAKAHGVQVVCITEHKNSPLAKLSDEVLLACASGRSLSGKANEVSLSQKVLSDTICAYIRSRTYEAGEKHYYEMSSILNSHNVKD